MYLDFLRLCTRRYGKPYFPCRQKVLVGVQPEFLAVELFHGSQFIERIIPLRTMRVLPRRTAIVMAWLVPGLASLDYARREPVVEAIPLDCPSSLDSAVRYP